MNSETIEPLDEELLAGDRQAVAIDFDGVITDPHELKRELFVEKGYEVEQTGRQYCLEVRGIPKTDYEWVSRTAGVKRLADVPVRAGARTGLTRLVDNGFKPVVVTSRHDDEVNSMLRYIERQDLPVAGYANTSRESKVSVVEEVDAVAFVDDSHSKIEAFLRQPTYETELFYFRNGGNQDIRSDHRDVTEVANWKDLVDAVVY